MTQSELITVQNLKKYYPLGRAWASGTSSRNQLWVRAVDGISFAVHEGTTLGIVGESGCGKTTTGRMVLRLEPPSEGSVRFLGRELDSLSGDSLREFRASVQAVFQDPAGSLNPRMRAGNFVAEPLVINTQLSRSERKRRVHELLAEVGLDPSVAMNFPHEFSGGQRQRIAIARALSLNPRLIVLDEPVSSLDVSIGAQIMNLLKDLQTRHGIGYILIAHNLATVRYLSDRIIVMYLGQVVEEADSQRLFENPLHPYTQALIEAARPSDAEPRLMLGGELPSPVRPPSGCRFHTRCPYVFEHCPLEDPTLKILESGHTAACHLYQNLDP